MFISTNTVIVISELTFASQNGKMQRINEYEETYVFLQAKEIRKAHAYGLERKTNT